MRTIFSGHFTPTSKEFDTLWNKALFCVDANVILNLYRYSEETRTTLEKLLKSYKERVFLPNQAGKEFLRHRLNVTSNQALEYQKAIDSLTSLSESLSKKNRHPFLNDDDQLEFSTYSEKLKKSLGIKKDELNKKLTNDEVLEFVENLFDGKTGESYKPERLEEIQSLGPERYSSKVPPGYKDDKKEDPSDPLRKYGDLIVWFQVIDIAISKKKPVIFITDDKKDDWWLSQSGKTVGPRPELVSEFHETTKQLFWMYPVDRFIEEASSKSSQSVSQAVLEEVKTVSSYRKNLHQDLQETNIEVKQNVSVSTESYQEGEIYITLNSDMRYATGTAKFHPQIEIEPDIHVMMVSCPDDNDDHIKLSTGCGTFKDFHVHMKGRGKLLRAGVYVFHYKVFAERDDANMEKGPFEALAALKGIKHSNDSK